uniref:Uncharacterized protein n=1 Tax=viral metagenome TaxID=1070528 RepID=A0A6H1ZNW6_9ZZZZ
MPKQEESEYHYFMCERCRHVVRAKSGWYRAKCPMCGGELEHDCRFEIFLRWRSQKGGEKNA